MTSAAGELGSVVVSSGKIKLTNVQQAEQIETLTADLIALRDTHPATPSPTERA